MTPDGLSRRHALTGAATVGLGLPLLAACGGNDVSSATDSSPTTSGSTSGGAPAGGAALAATSDIAVGGGTIFADEKVVVTQPSEGEFKAFTSICTHQGCPVTSVSDGEIQCRCHGSAFSIADGSVLAGPAPAPLGEIAITVKGGEITLA